MASKKILVSVWIAFLKSQKLTFVRLVCRHNDTMRTNTISDLLDLRNSVLSLLEVNEHLSAHFQRKLLLGLSAVNNNRSHTHGPVIHISR